MDRLPFIRFSTDDFGDRDRLDAWREAMAPMFDTRRPDTEQPFRGSAFTYLMGPLALGGTEVDALAYERTAGRIRSDYIDHYLVRLDYEPARPEGVLRVIDLGQPISLPAAPMYCLCLFIPRDVLAAALPGAESLHGREIEGPRGRLMADHIRSLTRHASGIGMAEGTGMAEATLSMLAACLAPSRDADARARSVLDATLIGQARRFIDARLTQPDLTPEAVGRYLTVSRTTLYRLFQPLGGVARYIQQRRLKRVHALLSDPTERRRIGDIAFEHGFADEAAFARAFRREFGLTASEVRASGGRAAPPPETLRLDLSPPQRMMLWGSWMADLGEAA